MGIASAKYTNPSKYQVRCEWGPEGIAHLSPSSDVIIIVDVFSFSTCVDIAVSRGCKVYPYAWRDESSREFAQSMGAIVAAASRSDPTGFSLAPSSMLRLPAGANVILPSPNGARLSLAAGDMPTITGCLRNAQAVASAAARIGARVSLLPAGERWENGSLRPALEDLLGAGAIIHALPGLRSPEAAAAEAVFLHFQGHVVEAMLDCGSGSEMIAGGWIADVELASALNVSSFAPCLTDQQSGHPYYVSLP